MGQPASLEAQLRDLLQIELPGTDPHTIEHTVDRILTLLRNNEFETTAREELQRYRETFTELAK